MSGENYLINSTTVKVNEPCSVRKPNQMPELMKKTRPVIGGSSIMDFEKQHDIYGVSVIKDDEMELNSTGPNRRCRRSVDSGIGSGGLLCYQDQFDSSRIYGGDFNGSASNLPYRNIRTVNFCQAFADQYRDILSGNNQSKLVSNPAVSQDLSNIPSNLTTYSTNGIQINKIKTANSSGSSFFVQAHQPTVTPMSQIIYPNDANDLRNQSKFIKSQNIAFLQKLNDGTVRNVGDDSLKRNVNPKFASYIEDGSLKFAEYNNLAFGSSNKILATNVPGRKDSVLSIQSDYYEADLNNEHLRDNIPTFVTGDSNDTCVSMSLNKDEKLTPTDFLYSNNFYLPTINMNEARNSISYIGQAIPVVMLKSSTDMNSRNINNYQQFCLTQLIPFSSDTVSTNHPNSNDHTNEGSESYLVLKREFMDSAKLYCPQIINEGHHKTQQFSSNNELSRGNNYSITADTTVVNPISNDELLPLLDLTMDVTEGPVTNNSDKMIDGAENEMVREFIINTAKVNDKSMSTLKSIENTENSSNLSLNFNKYMCNEDLNMNTNSDNLQPRSRFKKTRIRETIERWCINGLNTYDCRFKVIPSKIMNLRKNNQYVLSHEYHMESCKNYGDRDNGYRCHSTEYYNKEFRFWNSGDRIAICGKSDYEIENYCQFHAKFINLLHQNQNLSLSKFEPQSFSMPISSLTPSPPQIIRAVLISSPENENYTMNIDSNLSQNVALSAPPVSPSIMNSVPISSMALNLHSPQPAASMVMLRCQTPVILSSATLSATLMHESISIERIDHKTSSKMNVESDNTSVNEQSMDMWPNYPSKSDHLAFKFPAPGCMTQHDTDETIYSGQQSLYSVGPIPHVLYSIQQQVIPPIPPGITSHQNIDQIINFSNRNEYIISDPLSVNVIHEIDKSLNSLKPLIHSLVQSEQQPLLNEITSLTKTNENLKLELSLVKQRSEYLESVLHENHIPVDLYLHRENLSMPDLPITSLDLHLHFNHDNDDSSFDN